MKKERVAFFGGSFDPPHLGHLAVARGALASGLCDRVLWVPAVSPPHKAGMDRAPFEKRFEMVKLLIANEKSMDVSDVELRAEIIPSYTVDILDFYERTSGIHPLLLIGADSLSAFHTWKNCRFLADNYTILTYPRNGAEVTVDDLSDFWDRKTAEKLCSNIIPGDFFEISSTEVRNSMEKNNLTEHIKKRTLFPDVIAQYIKANALYNSQVSAVSNKPEEKNMSETEKKVVTDPKALAEFCVKCAEEKLAENTVLIDLGGVSSVADYFVVATANSEPQLRALTGFIERQVRETFQVRTFSDGGDEIGGWVLLDFGTVIVHLMTPEMREKYNLEGLWGDKKR